MLELKELYKTFNPGTINAKTALNGLSLTLNDGDFVTVIGGNGAGKSTMLNATAGTFFVDSGKVIIDGVDISDFNAKQLTDYRRNNIGFVFQFHQLLPEFTALENVMIPALIGGGNQSDAEQEAKRILDFLGLSDRLGHKPAQLSGGEKQRVAVARALINRPSVILADEPSGSLDSKNKIELHKLFFDLRDEFKQTFVIVTHDETLARMTDRTLFMKDGSIVSPASVEE